MCAFEILSNIPIDTITCTLFNKIRDENDEGDFSDRREIMYRLLSIGMFEKVVLVIVYQLVCLNK